MEVFCVRLVDPWALLYEILKGKMSVLDTLPEAWVVRSAFQK